MRQTAYALFPAIVSLVLLSACQMPGTTASPGDPPAVAITGYSGSFSYSVDAGTSPKDVYFVFSNTSVNSTSYSKPSVSGLSVDGFALPPVESQPGGAADQASLKARLHESNRDILASIDALPSRSGSIAGAIPSPSPPLADSVDQAGMLWDIGTSMADIQVGSHCRSVGGAVTVADSSTRRLNIWVSDECWSADGFTEGTGAIAASPSSKRHVVTQTMVDALSARFLAAGAGNDIYDWVFAIAGAEWGPPAASNLIPFSGEITILLSDIEQDNADNGGIVGYFWAGNNFKTSSVPTSNARVMFVIDAEMYANPNASGSSSTGGSGWAPTHYWAEEVYSTLAHEFQHMIQFYQKGILARGDGKTADTWINEMCSQLVEDLVADKLGVRGPRGVLPSDGGAGPAGNPYGRIPDFNQYLSLGLTKSGMESYSVEDYAFSYAFGAWLIRNFGGASFVRNVVQDPRTDSGCVTAAVASVRGKSVDMGELIQRWAVAILGSSRTDMPYGLRCNSGGWISSSAGGLAYNLGSIDFFNYSPAPRFILADGTLPSGVFAKASNVYYKAASGLVGSRTWSLVVPEGIRFSVFVGP